MAYEATAENEELVEEQDRRSDLVEPRKGRRKRRGRDSERPGFQDAPGELPAVRFRAVLAPVGSPIKISPEGESMVSLAVSAMDLAEVLKLTLFSGRLFTVIINTE